MHINMLLKIEWDLKSFYSNVGSSFHTLWRSPVTIWSNCPLFNDMSCLYILEYPHMNVITCFCLRTDLIPMLKYFSEYPEQHVQLLKLVYFGKSTTICYLKLNVFMTNFWFRATSLYHCIKSSIIISGLNILFGNNTFALFYYEIKYLNQTPT
jgi:hypothetical protein